LRVRKKEGRKDGAMRNHAILFLLPILALMSEAGPAEFESKGILRYPILHERMRFGEPGQVVRYSVSPSDLWKADVELNGRVFKDALSGHIVPYDSEFTVSWTYVRLQRAEFLSGSNLLEDSKYRYQLARNVLKSFPSHPLSEELHALLCEYAETLESFEGNGKTRYKESIRLLEEYLAKYPGGRHRDRLEWKLVQLRNYWYEFEGHAGPPITQARAYEKYLSERPESEVANDIRLTIAKLYRIAHEYIEHARHERYKDGFTEDDGRRFNVRSIEIYEELLKSQDLRTRERARVALYNMRHNRRVSLNANEW
jgi:hypothetical protein